MNTLKDAAALLILLTLLVSVRITPLEEPPGIVPEAQAATDPVVGPAVTSPAEPARLMKALGPGSARSDLPGDCPVRLRTLRTDEGDSRVIVIEVEQVEPPDPPAPAADSFAVGPTC